VWFSSLGENVSRHRQLFLGHRCVFFSTEPLLTLEWEVPGPKVNYINRRGVGRAGLL
jgi:hypothetical protein